MYNEMRKHLIFKKTQGYTSASNGVYILLGTLPLANNNSNNATFISIKGTLGTWSTYTNIDIVIKNRDGLRVEGTYTGLKGAFGTNTIKIYQQSDNTYKIYLNLKSYFGATDLELSTNNQGIIYNSTTEVSPTGTLVKTLDSSTLTNLEVYSSDEIRIGTWTNNKPIYRKVYSLSSFTGSDRVIPTGLSNVDEVVTLRGIVNNGGSDIFALSGGQYITQNLYTTSLTYLTSSNTWQPNSFYMVYYQNVPQSAKIIFEYTKTTD
jgi:hypothetical protein